MTADRRPCLAHLQVENAPPLQLISPNLNISLERRDFSAAMASPFGCPTHSDLATTAQVPRVALGSEEEVGAVMWTAAGDVHVAEPMVNMSIVGPPTSFTLYTADNHELDVTDSPEPILLGLSLAADSKKRKTREDEKLECRYYAEDLDEWSTEGCRTVDADGSGNLGCYCDHLSDFIAVKVPTKFEGEIVFANIDVRALPASTPGHSGPTYPTALLPHRSRTRTSRCTAPVPRACASGSTRGPIQRSRSSPCST